MEINKPASIFPIAMAFVLSTAGQLSLAQSQTLGQLIVAAKKQIESGANPEALAANLRSAQDLLDREKRNDQWSVASANVGYLYYQIGRYREAESLFVRALLYEENRKPQSLQRVSEDLSTVASVKLKLAKFTEAENAGKRAVPITEKAFSRNSVNTADALDNLANIYLAEGKLAEAEPLLKRSMELSEKLRPGSQDFGTTVNNLADLYHAQKKLNLAEPLSRRGLALQEKFLGEDSMQVATCKCNLASILDELHRPAEAVKLAREAYQTTVARQGEHNADTCRMMGNLAVILADAGNYDEAIPLIEKTIAEKRQLLGSNHPSLAASLKNYATILRQANRTAEAEAALSEANRIDLAPR